MRLLIPIKEYHCFLTIRSPSHCLCLLGPTNAKAHLRGALACPDGSRCLYCCYSSHSLKGAFASVPCQVQRLVRTPLFFPSSSTTSAGMDYAPCCSRNIPRTEKHKEHTGQDVVLLSLSVFDTGALDSSPSGRLPYGLRHH